MTYSLLLLAGLPTALLPAKTLAADPGAGEDAQVTTTDEAVKEEAKVPLNLQPPSAAVLELASYHFTDTQFETEVAGFRLMRRDVVSSTIGLPDIDVALGPEGDRYLPLVRLLGALRVQVEADKHVLRFQAEYAPFVELDLKRGSIAFDGVADSLQFLAGISEISNSREIFVSPQIFARIFNLDVEWEDDLYEYAAVTDEVLSVWKRERRVYEGFDAELIAEDLPELYGPATPDENSLDYVQVRISGNVSGREDDDVRASLNTAQDFWGGLLGGRYQLRFQQPDLSWQEGEGFDSGAQKVSVPRYVNWTKTFDKSEISLGDSNFAINELVLPIVDFTGARINGVLGEGSDKINELSGFKLDGAFVQTRRFEGEAELGSTVQLFINDALVATAEVYEEPDSPVGFGRYEFDEVSIPSGNLVAIRIEIEEPNGRRVVRDLSTVNSNKLRTAGQFSYVAGVGTVRDKGKWDSDGLIVGGRALYGVNQRLTVGATFARQEDATGLFTSSISSSTRPRATSSDHLGAELYVNPFSRLILGASFAQSEGEEATQPDGTYDGDAYAITADFLFHSNMSLYSRAYRYDTGFFNGVDVGLEDRQGYYGGVESRMKWFTLNADYGSVEDNVDDLAPVTTTADYFGARLSSYVLIPNTYVYVEHDEVMPDDFDSKAITTAGFRTNLYGFGVDGAFTDGDLFSLDSQARDLFLGIALPGVRITGAPSSSLAISRAFKNHRFVFEIDGPETDITQRRRFTHYWDSLRTPGGRFGDGSLRVVTEFDYNELNDETTASNRINWYLDSRRRNRVGLAAIYNSTVGWSWQLDFNFTNIFALRSGRVLNVSSASVNPSYGGTSGMVFLDRNANGIRDAGERGVEGIRVKSSDSPNGALTDRHGEFFLPRRANQDESVLFLDIDTVPATMIPVHGKQTAILERGLTSRAEFALSPMVSLTGVLLSPEAADPARDGEIHRKPLSGVRIELATPEGDIVGESITATDGSYFFNAIPGRYELWVDPQTVHPLLTFNEPAFTMSVVGVEEYQELEFEPIYAELLHKAQATDAPSASAPATTSPTTISPVQPAGDSAGSLAAPATGAASNGPAAEVVPVPDSEALAAPELDLTRPRVIIPAEPAADDFIGITHQLVGELQGELQGKAGFAGIEGVRLYVVDEDGREVAAALTDGKGRYRFELAAGSYAVMIDPLSIPVEYVYDVPALTLRVPRKETSQRIELKPVYANRLGLDQ